MEIQKGTKVRINHHVNGIMECIAYEDFDTATRVNFPLVLEDYGVDGLGSTMPLKDGQKVDCPQELCAIELRS